MEYQRGLNNSFGVSHVAHLGSSPDSPATYEFSANYSQDKHLLLSRTSPSGGDNTVLAQYILSASPNLTMRIQSQLSKVPHQSSAVVQLDYKGSDWFGQAKMGSFAQWGFSYMQSITRNLSLGLDYTYLGRPPYNNPPLSVQTGALRYANDRFAFIGQLVSSGQLQAAYVQRVRDNLSFGTELVVNLADRSSQCAVGYEYSSAAGAFKTNLSTDGKITSCLEKPLGETTMLTLCAELDHAKPAIKYGLGFQLMT